MKYIVLSFDDGFKDFKINALPVLDKYNLKSTVNIISGYSDKSVYSQWEYLSIDDIRDIDIHGHEIAIHSNSHLKKTNSDNFELCKNKISEWLGEENRGAVIPYSQSIDSSLVQYFQNNKYIYITDCGSSHNIKRSLKSFLYRIKNHFRHTSEGDIIVSLQNYVYRKKDFVKTTIPMFNRLPATRKNNVDVILKFLKMLNNGDCITIVFHSILNSLEEPCDYPFGAWTKNEFESFIEKLVSIKDIKVVTQKKVIYG